MHKRADEWRAKDIMYFKFNKKLSLIPSFRVPPSAKQPPQGTLSRQDLARIVAQMLG